MIIIYFLNFSPLLVTLICVVDNDVVAGVTLLVDDGSNPACVDFFESKSNGMASSSSPSLHIFFAAKEAGGVVAVRFMAAEAAATAAVLAPKHSAPKLPLKLNGGLAL